jgi:hypothetical protein
MAVGAILPVGESCPAGEDFLAPCRRYASRLRPRPLPPLAARRRPSPTAARSARRSAVTARPTSASAARAAGAPVAPAGRLPRSNARSPSAPNRPATVARNRSNSPAIRASARSAAQASARLAAPPAGPSAAPRAPIAASAAWDNLGAPVCAAARATASCARSANAAFASAAHRRRDRLPHPRGLGARRRAAEPASKPVRPCNVPSCPGSTAILRAAEVGPCEATRSSSRARARPGSRYVPSR